MITDFIFQGFPRFYIRGPSALLCSLCLISFALLPLPLRVFKTHLLVCSLLAGASRGRPGGDDGVVGVEMRILIGSRSLGIGSLDP